MKAQLDTVETKSWTDDIPVCPETGAGFASNQAYREDGTRQDRTYKVRDRSFYCRIDEKTDIYAIFSGHHGAKVADYALQRMSAEIVLGQLYDKSTDAEIMEVLRQASVAVEKAYEDSIDGNLTRKFMLQNEIPEGLNQYEISQGYQNVLDELDAINEILSVGCSVVLALIYNSKLYILNIGNCKALLCKTDSLNVLRLVQLSVDHNLNNADEAARLEKLGLDVQGLKQAPLPSTRCIGNYLGKGGYKDCSFLSAATSEPLNSTPEIVGGIPVDESCRFLMLLSSGMVNALGDIYDGDLLKADRELTFMTVEQFRSQSLLTGVAQSVVHKVAQFHHDTYMQKVQRMERPVAGQREDLTLLVRNFNFPMPNGIQKRPQQVRFDSEVKQHTLVSTMHSDSHSSSDSQCVTPTNASLDSESTASGVVTRPLFTRSDRGSNVKGANDKIKPYVDFSGFYERVELARQRGTLPKNINFD